MSRQIFSRFSFIFQMFVYSVIASAVIKYAAPNWSLLMNNLNVDTMNAIAFSAITMPVGLFAFILWLRR